MDPEKISLINKCDQRPNHRNQIIAVTGVTLALLASGCAGGFSAVALPSFIEPNSEIKATHAELSWIACMNTVGCILGNFIGGVISELFGRRKSIILTSIVSLTGWVMVAVAGSLAEIFVGRALTGLATGLYSAPIQVYIREIVDESIRGVAGAAPSLTVALGILLVYCLGSLLTWRLLALSCSVFPLVVMVYVYFLPESPTWLDSKGRHLDASRSRSWLRHKQTVNEVTVAGGHHADTHHTNTQINTGAGVKNGKFKNFNGARFSQPSVLRQLFVGMMLFFFQQFCGIFPILSYTTLIFRFSGQFMNAYLETICVGVVRLVSTILGIFLIKFMKGRTLLILSGVLMCLSNGILGSYFHLVEIEEEGVDGNFSFVDSSPLNMPGGEDDVVVIFDWIPLACLLVFMAAYSMGFGIVPWFLTPDLMPDDIRSVACSLVFTFGQICRVTAVKTFLDFVDLMGADGTFWAFSVISLTSVVFVTFFLKDGKQDSALDEDDKGNGTKNEKI